MTLEESLIRDEGLRLAIYRDTQGIETIGVGRNLRVGITKDEALYLLRNDIAHVKAELEKALPWYLSLSPLRQNVLCNMAFNLGVTGLLKFTATLAAIQAGDYERAAEQMLRSRWASQTKGRAKRLAQMMRSDREET